MGAGIQRWWRDYAQETAQFEEGLAAKDPRLVSAITDCGIHVRLVLWTTQPMYYATIRLKGDD